MRDPIPFRPELETRDEAERATIEDLNRTFDTILETVARDEDHAYRAVHAKSHGLLEARVTIPDALAPEYAQGLFAHAGTYEAIVRISTNPGDLLSDEVSVPRGFALKVIGAPGERLAGALEGHAQDFVMANGPVFSAPDARAFLGSLKLLAKTTDRAEWAKVALSKVLRGVEKVAEATVGGSATLQTMGGAPNSHPLGLTYFSQTPYRHGDYVAKYQIVPVSPNLTALAGEVVDASDDPDALRHAIDAQLRDAPARWELRAQLLRDPEAQPIEDATVEWPEAVSPFVTVATIEAAPQPGWTEARRAAVDDRMRFAPWNGLEAHRPLGSVNRARKATYDHSAAFRSEVNGCPIHHPTHATLPG